MKTIFWMTLFISGGMMFADVSLRSLNSLALNAVPDHAYDIEHAEVTARGGHNYYSGFSKLSALGSAE